MTLSACADAQADKDFHCPHIPEDLFSHGATRLCLVYKVYCKRINENTSSLQAEIKKKKKSSEPFYRLSTLKRHCGLKVFIKTWSKLFKAHMR